MIKNDIILQNELYGRLAGQLDRLPHALLLHGARGIGKLELAERLAQLLLCEGRGAGLAPCGRCDGCRWFAAGSHPDLRVVEPESVARARGVAGDDSAGEAEEEGGAGRAKRKPSIEIRIDQIRQLDDFVHLRSHRGQSRVVIIHPAEDMNGPTANALLKNLEEPPPGAVFVLVAHRPARLLPTVRSRCVGIAVSPPDAAVAVRWLEAQGVHDASSWLAFVGGAPLRAMDLARDGTRQQVAEWRKAIGDGRLEDIHVGADREALELLVDVLQKHALDQALLRFGQMSKYTFQAAKGQVSANAWLAYARALGRERALARHPLNPRLFVDALLGAFPTPART